MSLYTETIGSGPRIVLVHGFTQNGRCWEPLASWLARDHEVVLVDAPGHGLSHHDDVDLVEAGRLILEAGSASGDGESGVSDRPEGRVRATYVGYSMGARMLLHAALSEVEAVESGMPGSGMPGSGMPGSGMPEAGRSLIQRLVLIGATGGLEFEADRIKRREADRALAASIEADGLEAFLDRWLALPMFAGLSAESSAREERLENRVSGLAASLRNSGTGTQVPLWGRLSAIQIPVAVLVGADDQKFGPLGARLASSIGPNASKIEIPGGHAVHLESPELVLPFLTS